MSSSPPHLLFAPASGPGVGGGHVMRCGALAEAAADAGARCTFVTSPPGAAVLRRFYGGRFRIVADGRAADDAARELRPDGLLFDDYAVDAALERRARPHAGVLAALDDLADRPHAVDLLIDTGPDRTPSDYARLAPGAELALGPAYALVRPQFRQAPPRAAAAGRPDRVLVSLGLSDVDGVHARAAAVVRRSWPRARLDVVLAHDARSRPALEAAACTDPALTLHVDARDMASLMAAADAAVGAGGSSAWERCAAGLPTVAVIVADNQRPLMRALSVAGAAVVCELAAAEFEADLAGALERLEDAGLREAMSAAGRRLCDGRGAERAAARLLALVSSRE